MKLTVEGRSGFLWGFFACVASLAFAYYLQYFQDLEPCPLCILQRVAIAAAGVFFLMAGVINPQGWKRVLLSLFPLAASLAGAGIAGRHVWLQSLPPDQVPACGPPLDYLLNMMPVTEAVAFLLKGEGSCAVIDASFLGLSLPGWTLLVFIGLSIWTLLCALATENSNKGST